MKLPERNFGMSKENNGTSPAAYFIQEISTQLSSFWRYLSWPCTREGKESKQHALRLVYSR